MAIRRLRVQANDMANVVYDGHKCPVVKIVRGTVTIRLSDGTIKDLQSVDLYRVSKDSFAYRTAAPSPVQVKKHFTYTWMMGGYQRPETVTVEAVDAAQARQMAIKAAAKRANLTERAFQARIFGPKGVQAGNYFRAVPPQAH